MSSPLRKPKLVKKKKKKKRADDGAGTDAGASGSGRRLRASELAGSSSSVAAASMGTLAAASPKRASSGKRRSSKKSESKQKIDVSTYSGGGGGGGGDGAAPALAVATAGPASRRAMEDGEEQFRREEVANKMSTPKRVKDKKKKKEKEKDKDKDKAVIGADVMAAATRAARDAGVEAEAEGKRENDEVAGPGKGHKDEDEDEYADDFEDYADDFEDLGEEKQTAKHVTQNAFAPQLRSGKSAAAAAAAKEQARAGSATAGAFQDAKVSRFGERETRQRQRQRQRQHLDEQERHDQRLGDGAVGVSLGAAAGGRGAALRALVTLREVKIDVFDQPSLPPWERYMQSVGAGGSRRQRFSQTNDDGCEREAQTEPVEARDAAVGDGEGGSISRVSRGSGGGRASGGTGGGAAEAGSGEEKAQDGDLDANEEEGGEALDGIDDLAYQMGMLLDEASTARQRSMLERGLRDRAKCDREGKSEEGWCQRERLVKVDAGFGGGGDVVDASFAPGHAALLCVAQADGPGSGAGGSVVSLWDLQGRSGIGSGGAGGQAPVHVLQCVATVTKCVANPPPHLSVLLAGADDGTIFVWDLRQAALAGAGVGAGARAGEAGEDPGEPGEPMHPAYCSFASDGGHTSGICDMALLSTRSSPSQLGFQVATLDELGFLHVWSVLHLASASTSASRSDAAAHNHGGASGANIGMGMGMGMGSAADARLQIVHVAVVDTLGSVAAPSSAPALANCFAAHPRDRSRLMVGASGGGVLQCSRFADRAPAPRRFALGAPGSGTSSASSVSCIAFHPRLELLFLVGFSTGEVALFEDCRAAPLRTWAATTTPDPRAGSGFAGVAAVRWAPQCASAFFVADDAGALHVWDVERDGDAPVATERPASGGRGQSEGPSRSRGVLAVSAGATSAPLVVRVAADGASVAVHAVDTRVMPVTATDVPMVFDEENDDDDDVDDENLGLRGNANAQDHGRKDDAGLSLELRRIDRILRQEDPDS